MLQKRFEVGPQDVKKGQVIAVRRDTGEKIAVPIKTLIPETKELLKKIGDNLRDRAWKSFREAVHDAKDVDAIKRIMEKRGGIVRVAWCGQEECGKALEEQTGGEILGDEIENKKIAGKCPICSSQAKHTILIARTY